MREELHKHIIDTFPLLYKDMHGGIAVRDGWYNIIFDLSEKLEQLCIAYVIQNPKQPKPRVVQIKEKFGGLRFYMDYATSDMHKVIMQAEERSYKVCEICGADGALRQRGWMVTLCDDCNNQR